MERAGQPVTIYEERDTPPACHLWPSPQPGQTYDEWQRGHCAICGGAGRAEVLDHCHRTGFERGLLCRSCNTSEGMTGAGAMLFQLYRLRPPAVIIGRTQPYIGAGYAMSDGPARPQKWVVDSLGEAPSDPAEAALYLAAAALLPGPPHDFTHNALVGIGL